MADFNAPIKPKKSSTASEVPQASDLEVAEIAINTADGLMWTKHTDNSIVAIGGGGGSATLDGLTDTTITSPTNGQVLKYNGSAWINDTDSVGSNNFYTDFESGSYDPTFGGSTPSNSSLSTDQAYAGTQSMKDTGGYLDAEVVDAFNDANADYYASSFQVYPTTQLNEITLFGYRDFNTLGGSGAGFTVYTSTSNQLKIYGLGAVTAFGDYSGTSFTLNQWNHVYVQIHWANGHTQAPSVAVWINGVHAGYVAAAGVSYLGVTTSPTYMDSNRSWRCSTVGTAGAHTKYYDDLRLKSSDTPFITQTSTAAITPAAADTWLEQNSLTELTQLSDVSVVSPSNGQVLKYNGTIWVNDTDNSGGGVINDLSDVTITSATAGQVLKYDGAAWINDTDNAAAATTYSAGSLTDTYGGAVDSDVYYGDTTFLVKGEGTNGSQTLTNVVNSSFSNSPVGTIENSTDYAFKGNGSIKVNNGRCTFPNNASFDLADSDFTIEWFVYNYGFGISGAVFFNGDDQGTGTQYGWQARLSTGVPPGVLYFDWSDDGVGTGASTYKTTWDLNESASIGAWQHFAIVRQGSLLTAYQNGTPLTLASGTDVINDTIWTSTSSLKLFKSIANGSDGALCYAYYDNLRITKRARYYQQFKPIDYDFAVLQQPQAPRTNEVLKWNDLKSQWEPSPEQGVAGLGQSTAVPAITSTDIVSNDSTPSSMNVSLTANSGELIVLVVMHRNNGIPTSSGFTRYQDRSFANINFSLGSNDQRLSILTKTATASEPGSYTITSTGSFGGVVGAVVKNTSGIASVIESRGNGDTAIIDTDASTLNLTVAHWIYSNATSETYSQSGTALTQITDSPVANARMSGGYTNNATTVVSTHSTTTLTWSDDPNHQMVNIQFKGPVNISPCPIYADNTAASGGGLTFGDVYRTATGELRIVY